MIKVKDIMNCFPFEDPCVVIAANGNHLLEALENAVSKYPALEGRFPQVSGIEFSFDPAKPAGLRCRDVTIGSQPINLEKEYKTVTRDYMVSAPIDIGISPRQATRKSRNCRKISESRKVLLNSTKRRSVEEINLVRPIGSRQLLTFLPFRL